MRKRPSDANKIRLSIFGSCVTRDILTFDADSRIELENYIARQSVISAVCPKIGAEESEINLSSPFQKRMVLCDMNKTAFEILGGQKSDFIILDLVDERFPLKRVGDSFLTVSNEFRLSLGEKYRKYPDWYKRVTAFGLYAGHRRINKYVKLFCENLTNIYPENRIILHRALTADRYINKFGEITPFDTDIIKNNSEINDVLNKMYDIIIKTISSIYEIAGDTEILSDERQRWGLAPMHYTDGYYISMLNKIYEIADIELNK